MKKALLTCSILAAFSAPSWSLNILLANDDGCASEGIQAMKTALINAGHSVDLYAPASQQSGKSGSIETKIHRPDYGSENKFIVNNIPYSEASEAYIYTEGQYPASITTPELDENDHCVRIARTYNPENWAEINKAALDDAEANGYTIIHPQYGEVLLEGWQARAALHSELKYIREVSATPRDSMLVGLAVLRDKGIEPDLIISGINDGQNVGLMATTSGTVGLAVAGLQRGVPSIAVSNFTSELDGRGGESHRSATDEEVAMFTVQLVAELEAKRIKDQPLLPAFTGLNVNFPGTFDLERFSKEIKGVAHTVLGGTSDVLIGPGIYIDEETLEKSADIHPVADYKVVPQQVIGGADNDETKMYLDNYITITPIDGDYTAGLRKQELLKVKLRDVTFTAAEQEAAQ
ncbi:MAG: 5'/3'-nucleotidase SurE [Pseudomonadales bacterium]|nr:5'/3'-nucleotidase SurE [Pseudomonadales bacterium]